MGSNNSKTGVDKPKVLKSNLQPLTISENCPSVNETDPRSPTFCRTPLNENTCKNQNTAWNINLQQIQSPISKAKLCQNPREILKQKLLKDIQQNLIDPRSPSNFINRTPIILNDTSLLTISTDVSLVDNEHVVDLNDSFSNLEISSKMGSSKSTDETNDVLNNITEQNFSDMNTNIGVESTPVKEKIINGGKGEDIVMEDFNELISQKENVSNKQINRIKAYEATNQKKTIIFEDENATENCITPVKRSSRTPTRTPLSCLGNKTHYRSKSVENLEDSPKPKIRPLCFDDNSVDNLKVLKKSANRSPAYDHFKRRQDSKTTKMHLLRKV